MNKEEKICAIFAADPMDFPWGYDEEAEECGDMKRMMQNEIRRLIEKGYHRFHVVMDNGFGLYAAEHILSLRRETPGLSLRCFIPGEDQATKWTPEHRERYFNVLAKASEVTTVQAEDFTSEDYETQRAAGDAAQIAIVITAGLTSYGSADQAKRDFHIRDGKELIEIDFQYGLHHHNAG